MCKGQISVKGFLGYTICYTDVTPQSSDHLGTPNDILVHHACKSVTGSTSSKSCVVLLKQEMYIRTTKIHLTVACWLLGSTHHVHHLITAGFVTRSGGEWIVQVTSWWTHNVVNSFTTLWVNRSTCKVINKPIWCSSYPTPLLTRKFIHSSPQTDALHILLHATPHVLSPMDALHIPFRATLMFSVLILVSYQYLMQVSC